MFKQIVIYFLSFIQILLLVSSIVLLIFPVLAIVIYDKSQSDLSLKFAFINASYPWSLLEKPAQFFMFAGMLFFIGLVVFILSYIIGKLVAKLRG